MTTRPPLSMLDLAIVSHGRDSHDALHATTQVARLADKLGYKRFWVAEHHNMPSVASTTPPVLMAHLAASTQHIRVGSGGIMLPNHPPLVVAEHIAALEALHPGRIDLGIGRAPGTDQRTATALRRRADQLSVEEFPRDLLDMMALLGDPRRDDCLDQWFRATPVASSAPEIWMLGSSGYSAQLAGMLGLRFAFAHHFGTGGTEAAADLYRSSFEASPVLDTPYLLITANVLVAESDEDAQRLAAPGKLMARNIGVGVFEPLRPPDEARQALDQPPPSDPLRLRPTRPRTGRLVGTADHVVTQLDALAATTKANEIMVSTVAYDVSDRLQSVALLAKAWDDNADGNET